MPDFSRASSDVAIRFHRTSEWYTVSVYQDVQTFEIHANSERIVDLMFRLAAHLDSVVDVFIRDARAGKMWTGTMRFLPEIREALGRLRWPLAAYGGVELVLVTPTDQITITESLALVIYSRTTDWSARLDAERLTRATQFPPAVWTPVVHANQLTPDLDAALATIAERLDLEQTA